ncbi:SRPBCC family protein [Sphingomonas lenta]|uniref:ATPase n=1 Tax=Sphingomonas lenta TaxID=1141887 RepID=A0A2A2SDQ0_9SPHN|nr:SRPBCC domain-containing protein [Sphingomonas lenta]PAX07379.1 ATPase [Sphingomonas lenta]
MRYLLLPAALALHLSSVEAKVVSAASSGFEVASEAVVQASPERVWAALAVPATWWNPAHSWSGDAANLSLDLKSGGCFCERWAGGAAEHMRVTYVQHAKTLRMAGALGPLQAHGVAGAMTITLEPAATGTRLTLRYVVGGSFPGGLDRVAPAVDGVLAEQVGCLKATAEKR